MSKINRQRLLATECVYAVARNETNVYEGELALYVTPAEQWKAYKTLDNYEACYPLIERIAFDELTHEKGAMYTFKGTEEDLHKFMGKFRFLHDLNLEGYVNQARADERGGVLTAGWDAEKHDFEIQQHGEFPFWILLRNVQLAIMDDIVYDVTVADEESFMNDESALVTLTPRNQLMSVKPRALLWKDRARVAVSNASGSTVVTMHAHEEDVPNTWANPKDISFEPMVKCHLPESGSQIQVVFKA